MPVRERKAKRGKGGWNFQEGHPFYDEEADVVVKYGAIGTLIAHDLTHAFDGLGRQFDATGTLRDWWTARDAREFKKRSRCFVRDYSGFTAVDEVTLNGRLTLDENIADNGGLRIAYLALKDRLRREPVAPAGDFTPEQRFFPRQCTGLVRHRVGRAGSLLDPERRALPAAVPRERRRLEHA